MIENFKINIEMLALIVDDDDFCYKILSTYLKIMGVNYVRASSGIEAMEVCASNQKISLVLLDMQLPDMDGIAICKAIRKMSPGMVVIFQTGVSDPVYKDLGIEAGARYYLTKPIIYRELLSIFKDLDELQD